MKKEKKPSPYEKTLEEHAKLIKKIAYSIFKGLPDCVSIDDLIQDGVIGAMDAYENYDPNRGASFETYAGIRIRGAILDGLRRLDMRPRSVNSKLKIYNRAVSKIEQSTKSAASKEAVSKEMGVPIQEVNAILNRANVNIVFFRELEIDDYSKIHLAASGEFSDPTLEPLTFLENIEYEELIKECATKTFSPRDYAIWDLFYNEEKTLKYIGEIYGVSESRISQIIIDCIEKILSFSSQAYKENNA